MQPHCLPARRLHAAPCVPQLNAAKPASRAAKRQRRVSAAAQGHLQAVLSPDKPAVQQERQQASGDREQPQAAKQSTKLRVVVLGSGWGAVSFIKALNKKDAQKLDITLISPRNYYLYTPLLPAAATGTVEERSIIEPIRRILHQKGRYYEALCQSIDPAAKTLTCSYPENTGLEAASSFTVPYDILVLGVGSVNNTFGIQGVEQHTSFFKTVEDAKAFRRKVLQCFERAALPDTSTEMRKQLLSFVVTGGGPTGVEVAAELHDMVVDDMKKIYPELIQYVAIRVIELQDHVLSTYDRAISRYTAELFGRSGINLVLNSKVQSVAANCVTVSGPDGQQDIPFGASIWATGVAMHPLVKDLQGKLPAGSQTNWRSIATDAHLRVKGSEGSIYAFGDASTIEQDKALEHASELWEQADTDKNGQLTLQELRNLLRTASKRYSHMEEHSRFLDGRFGGGRRWGGMVNGALQGAQKADKAGQASIVGDLDEATCIDKEAFEGLLGKIDRGLRALPATAQVLTNLLASVAAQQGQYLAKLLAKGGVAPGVPLPQDAAEFRYKHKGSLAYVGRDNAVMDVNPSFQLTGKGAGLMWKGYETIAQVSFRNALLVSGDWIRAKLFGRDISSV